MSFFEANQLLVLKKRSEQFCITGIFPDGQAGMTETHVQIRAFTGETFRLTERLARDLFDVFNPEPENLEKTELEKQTLAAFDQMTEPEELQSEPEKQQFEPEEKPAMKASEIFDVNPGYPEQDHGIESEPENYEEQQSEPEKKPVLKKNTKKRGET